MRMVVHNYDGQFLPSVRNVSFPTQVSTTGAPTGPESFNHGIDICGKRDAPAGAGGVETFAVLGWWVEGAPRRYRAGDGPSGFFTSMAVMVNFFATSPGG